MRQTTKSPGEKIVKDIKRATRRQYSSEEKIRIVLDGLRGEDSITELCRREGNDALKRRGSLTIWFDPEISWDAAPTSGSWRSQISPMSQPATCSGDHSRRSFADTARANIG